MATKERAKKEYRVYSVEASNSSTPGSYQLVAIPTEESFKSYEDAQNWINTEGEENSYTILEVFTNK